MGRRAFPSRRESYSQTMARSAVSSPRESSSLLSPGRTPDPHSNRPSSSLVSASSAPPEQGYCHSHQLNYTAFPSIPLSTHLHCVSNHLHLTTIRKSSSPVATFQAPYKTSLNPYPHSLVSRLQVLRLSYHVPAGSLWLCGCLPPVDSTQGKDKDD